MKTLNTSIFLLFLFLTIHSFSQTWQWGKHFGSVNGEPANTNETINGIGLDSSGNIYVAGKVLASAFMDDSIIATNHGPYYQGFLTKYDCEGNKKWVQMFLSNDNNDKVTGLVVDEVGNCYVTGAAGGQTTYFGNNTYNLGAAPGFFLAKYDSNGVFQWVRFPQLLNYLQSALGSAIGLNSQGTVIIGGECILDGINVFPGISLRRGKFIAAFNPITGNPIWGNNIDTGSVGDFKVYGLTVDNADNIYVSGYIYQTVYISGQTFSGGPVMHAMLAKYNPIGTFQWARQGNATSNFDGFGGITSMNNNIYLYGRVLNNDTLFGYPVSFTGSNNCALILKLDGDGNLIAGIHQDSITSNFWDFNSFAKDKSNTYIYSTGSFKGRLKFGNTFPSITSNTSTRPNPYILELDTNLNVISLFRPNCIGGNQSTAIDGGHAIAINNDNDIYLGGAVSAYIFAGPDTIGNYGGINDLFLAKYGEVCSTSVNVNEINNKTDITIYPNPSTGNFNIQAQGKLEIYNTLGEKIHQQILTSAHQQIQLNASPGIYFVRVSDGEKSYTQKLVIE
jgi:hypothetical protein